MNKILKYEPDNINFYSGAARYEFTPGGDVCCFYNGDYMVSRLVGNCLDGGGSNLWLRIYGEEIRYTPLLGIQSLSKLERSQNCLRYRGRFCGVDYTVTFHAQACGWIWEVLLEGEGQTVDVVFGMDVGLGLESAVLDNDLYICQYLGHTILEEKHGYVICSRQNLPQGEKNPCLQVGMLEGNAVRYSTDAMQFFGKEYKFTNEAKALKGNLDCYNYQFECAYPALQSEKIVLNQPQRLLFYGFVQEDHPDAVHKTVTEKVLADHLTLWEQEKFSEVSVPRRKKCFGTPLCSEKMDEKQLKELYPVQELPEEKDGRILSFFDSEHTHIIMQEKELEVERPHVNIITTFINTKKVDQELITSTCNIYGVFNGQTVIGNTNFHKLLSWPRGLLNSMKSSGMRIWIEIKGQYRLLTMPAVFENGLNYCRWIYLIEGRQVTVETFAVAHSTDLITRVHGDEEYNYIVTAQLVMGTYEYCQPAAMEKKGDKLILYPASDTPTASAYPELKYEIFLPENSEIGNDGIFFEDGQSRNQTFLTVHLKRRRDFEIRIHGTLDGKTAKPFTGRTSLLQEKKEYLSCYRELLQGFCLKGKDKRISVLNTTVYWFAHNALVHFAVPHGPEQPGGAAWGTRDICQGPFEFFMAVRQYSLLRSILLTIFTNQHKDSGEWAQWFMFDRYTDEMDGCHGDIVFWPLKCMGDYLRLTGDFSILEEKLPFKNEEKRYSVYEHLEAALDAIEQRFLPGTALISYAGGDWDDTLQPCSPEMKKRLVSSWTQALAYQVLSELGSVLDENELSVRCRNMAQHIREAFFKFLVYDGVIAGFVYRLDDGGFKPMLHPKDQDTGIHYRLLPMTRSIISGLSDEKLAADSMLIIEEKLHCPDGVRLMDHPAHYSGGVCHLFRRAEQAANIGREISLQYTHAHIRYIEALCCMGKGDLAWDSLFEVNPVDLHNEVSNALPRQRNMYFSSSDGDFYDRWIYEKECCRLWKGEIKVKGGWRLYSSGPGIYLHQLLCNILGIRVKRNVIEIDPVLPKEIDGTFLHLTIDGKKYIFLYHVQENGAEVCVMQEGHILPFSQISNLYRNGGVRIALHEIEPENLIHIFLK